MKNNLVYLLCVIALLTSCSTAYKTSQTPDDVYYSPGQKIYSNASYETDNASADDEYLHMKVRHHEMWSTIDDYDYWYDSRYYSNNYYNPYISGFSLGVGYAYAPYHSYNPYGYNPWSSWYSPCYTVVYYKNPTVYYRPVRNYNSLSTYNNKSYNNYNMPLQNGNRSNAYSNSNSNANRSKNSIFNQNNNSNPARMFNGGGGSMSSGSRISGGGVRTRP